MKNRLFQLFIVAFASISMWGCSLDGAQVLQHPDWVRPGETFEVDLLNSFIHLTNGPLVMSDVIRDSLHVGIGLPGSGWSVVSLEMYAAPHYRPLAELDGMTPEELEALDSMPNSFADSMLVYQTRMEAMDSDPAMAGFFTGKEFDLDVEGTDSSFTLNADTVFSWETFSAPVNLQIDAGTRCDMVVANEDTTIDVDSIGYIMIPVFIHATIRAGTELSQENMYYYTKTGAMPVEDPDSTTIDVDQGDMTYYPITVSNTAAVWRMHSGADDRITVSHDQTAGWRICVSLNSPSSGPLDLEIYTNRGQLVQSFPFTPAPGSDTYHFQWNGADRHGQGLDPGVYLLSLQGEGRSISKKLVLR
jgi:hypothetical protein